MKISIRFAEHLQGPLDRRGLIAEIEQFTGIERHTVSALLNNTAKYVSLDALARISDYLVKKHGVDPSLLPGALLGRDPEHFWEALATCEQLDFCLGTRISPEWPGSDYVMSADARLQGRLLSTISRFATGVGTKPAKSVKEPASRGRCPNFHLVTAPDREVTVQDPGSQWPDLRHGAEQLYESLRPRKRSAVIALGSVKVNPMVELLLAQAFSATPFVTQDDVLSPQDRRCPILFRYRDYDPQPPSCAGGMELAAELPASQPGLYYETKGGSWELCPWDPASSDVAFLFYRYFPPTAQVEVTCGGFSGRATSCLTEQLEEITSELGEPQYVSEHLHLGLYVIHFTFDPADTDFDQYRDDRPFETRVIRLDDAVIARRLKNG
jgi:hypothetical protein